MGGSTPNAARGEDAKGHTSRRGERTGSLPLATTRPPVTVALSPVAVLRSTAGVRPTAAAVASVAATAASSTSAAAAMVPALGPGWAGLRACCGCHTGASRHDGGVLERGLGCGSGRHLQVFDVAPAEHDELVHVVGRQDLRTLPPALGTEGTHCGAVTRPTHGHHGQASARDGAAPCPTQEQRGVTDRSSARPSPLSG